MGDDAERLSATDPGVDEAAYLAAYDASRWPTASVTVDVACFTIRQGRLSVLLVERAGHPFRGAWALPGGFVGPDEDLADAAVRELAEETGVERPAAHLEQLGSYGRPGRDPRARVVSVAYLVFAADLPDPHAASDAARARFWAVEDLDLAGAGTPEGAPALAFDHAAILTDALGRARAKLEYTSLATTFLPEPFTVGELQRVYEAVWGVPLNRQHFARKVRRSVSFLEKVDQPPTSGPRGGRPTELYRRGPAELLHPPLLQPSSRAAAHLREPDLEDLEP